MMTATLTGGYMVKNNFFISVFAVFTFLVLGVSGVDTVMEGDSVTLYTGVKMNPEDRIRWYFKDIRIAYITGDQSQICTGDQCKEIFRDRLKLDHQTGSLTITNTRTEDSGEYQLMINSNSEKIFSVSVIGVSAAQRDEVKRKSVKEGESVTLDPGVIRKLNHSMTWYINDILIAEITGDQSKICTDIQCKERFRDRLKLDHQTGSLTITNTRNTDSGDYKLKIKSSRFMIIKSFSVSVTGSDLSAGVSGSGRSSAVASIFKITDLPPLLLAFAPAVVAAGLIYYCRRSFRKGKCHLQIL